MTARKIVQALLLCAALVGALHVPALAQTGKITPIRPPAVPLIVRSPYVSTWQSSSTLPGTWPAFWTGGIKAIVGIARVDGVSYLLMGSPYIPNAPAVAPMTQVSLIVTPTRSAYMFQGGGVNVWLDFLSPVEPHDLQRLSMPFGNIYASAKSADGKPHTVTLYFDISGEWAHGDDNALIGWTRQSIPKTTLTAWAVTPSAPTVLGEVNQYPMWGTAIWATPNNSGLTTEAGQDQKVRSEFVNTGQLSGAVDANQPRAINNNWPVFAFSFNGGTVNSSHELFATMLLGHVRNPAVSYLGTPVPPLWASYWPNWQTMLTFAANDRWPALARSVALDNQITADATQAGGAKYAALCALALRQAYGATELVGTPDKPWMFMKEISSDGNVSTVDVVYPAFPVFLYTNPYLLRLQLDPLLAYAETGGWPKVFAEHDIGSSYPNAAGHNDGNEEDMPVEESANMLIMSDAYMRYSPQADASAYATQHYTILKQWADYEVQNALMPAYQNQTDDFTGSIANSANLALKGILGVGAMGQIAGYAGNASDAAYYTQTAQSLIGQWATLAHSKTGNHLVLAYGQDDTWSLKYNAFPDKVLGLNLVAPAILQEEAAYYKSQINAFGVPLDPRHTYTKDDWEIWTAASTDDLQLRQDFVNSVYNFANTSNFRGPFSDWYDTISGQQVGFEARPVVGGMYAILDRTTLTPTPSAPSALRPLVPMQ